MVKTRTGVCKHDVNAFCYMFLRIWLFFFLLSRVE